MNMKKSIFWLVSLLMIFAIFGNALPVAAATEFTLAEEGCKDLVNDGIPYTASVSIAGNSVEFWRDRIQVQLKDPDGNYYNPLTGTDNVMEVVLYAASGSTAYQCQQLTTDTEKNSFSCNSFPAGGTIGRIDIRFIPNFTGAAPDLKAIQGTYTFDIVDLNDTTKILLEGNAKVDAYSTACAWNQLPAAFLPAPGTEFVYENCVDPAIIGDIQTFSFVENQAKPFTIVSFPMGETIDRNRFKVIGLPKDDKINYTIDFFFDDNDADETEDADLRIRYDYVAATKTETLTVPAAWSGPSILDRLPIKLLGGSLAMSNAVHKNLLPSQVDFSFILYYQNVDPTLGYENSMFHFERDMSVQISAYCSADPKYKLVSTPFDPCLASKQVFSVSFIDPATALGYDIENDSTYWVGSTAPYLPTGTYDNTQTKKMFFDTRKCTNTACTTLEGTDAYLYRVYLSDGTLDNRYYHYLGTLGRTVTEFHMKLFKSVDRPLYINSMLFTASSAGTYRVRAFIPDRVTDSGYENRAWMEFYITIPQKDGQDTCRSSGQDGQYRASWDGCGEDYTMQTIEFNAINEQYGFVSNYSNQTLTYELSPARSTMPAALELTEVYCEGQILADGRTLDGSLCSPQKLVLPPYTRIIIKGGKFKLTQKPKFNNNNDPEFILAYNRPLTDSNMNLFVDINYKECPREAIPDTGYSLRSPQPMSVKPQEFIFTGNSLQIPAIGLGMEYAIPIVHVYYLDGAFENGWDLSMLGGYIGELEGGAYIPYGGNAVLTGHYYSQGVFVNLTNLKLEDEIIVYATDGMKYTYQVTNSYWTEPNDVYQMFQPNGEKSLTLVTCDDYNFIDDEYHKRYIVQATMVTSEPYQ